MLGSVPNNLEVPVAAKTSIDAGVPLADLCRGVTLLAKFGRPKRTLLRIVSTAWVLAFHPHGFDTMLMFARKHRGSRWHAPCTDVSVVEAGTLPSQFVDVGRLNPFESIGVAANCTMRLIVRVDEQDIGSLFLFLICSSADPRAQHAEQGRELKAKQKEVAIGCYKHDRYLAGSLRELEASIIPR